MRTAAALCLLLALLAGCSGEPAPDIDAQLKRLGVAVAGLEDAVETGADDQTIARLVIETKQYTNSTLDEGWTDDQRRQYIDLLKTFDAAVERWKSAAPGREVPGMASGAPFVP